MTAQTASSSGVTLLAAPGRRRTPAPAHRPAPAAESGPAPTGFATCALNGDPEAAGVARHFTRCTLRSWDLAALVDDAELIVSELLSNAIRHGLNRAGGCPARTTLVGLGLLRQGATVVCAVSDPSSDVPVVREPDHFAESGRGLLLVDALADRWGVIEGPFPCKTVWAECVPR